LYAGSTVSGLIEKSFGLMDKTPLPSKFKEQTDKIVGKLFADDERFFLKFKTTGKLAKPSAKLVSELPEIKNLKEMLRDEVERGVKNKLLDLLKN